jgi:hypothetical protein
VRGGAELPAARDRARLPLRFAFDAAGQVGTRDHVVLRGGYTVVAFGHLMQRLRARVRAARDADGAVEATHRVVITVAPTDAQVEQARALVEAAALYKASQPEVPAHLRVAVGLDARRELVAALAGDAVPVVAAKCCSAVLAALRLAHRVERVAFTTEETFRLPAFCYGCMIERVEQEGHLCLGCEGQRAADEAAEDPNADSRLTARDLGVDRSFRD